MDKFTIIQQPKTDSDFQILRVYGKTKQLIDQMAEMTGVKKVQLVHQMVLFCMDRLEIIPAEE